MAVVRYVNTRAELKQAIEDRPDLIIIKDKRLAKDVSTILAASDVALGAAIVTVTTALAMSWNPIGWGLGLAAVSAGGVLAGAVAFLVVTLGLGILWALWKGWKITAKGKVTINGVVYEGEVILEPR